MLRNKATHKRHWISAAAQLLRGQLFKIRRTGESTATISNT